MGYYRSCMRNAKDQMILAKYEDACMPKSTCRYVPRFTRVVVIHKGALNLRNLVIFNLYV